MTASVASTLVLLFCCALTAHAHGDELAIPLLAVSAGYELDDDDSERLQAGLIWQSAGGTSVDAAVTRMTFSDAQSRGRSMLNLLEVSHDFGVVGLRAGVRSGDDEHVADHFGWLVGGFVDVADVRISTGVQWRSSDLDEIAFAGEGDEFGLERDDVVTGTSTCSVDSLGYEVKVRWSIERAAIYASGVAYDYDDYDCSTEWTFVSGRSRNPNGRPDLPEQARGVARGRVERAVAPLSSSYVSRLTPEYAAFLESSLMAGGSFNFTYRSTLGAEVHVSREEFSGDASNTFLVYGEYLFADHWSTELTLGQTDADAWGSSAFVGLSFTYFR